jgi:GntR family transcriptional regulator, transcriptional repressor for pyruvate dehydrogenase complex
MGPDEQLMAEFNPTGRRKKSDDISDRLLEQILGGRYLPGEKLPPERELAATFDTNRNTLREALRNLQTLRVVSARQGDGLRVLDYETDGEINLLPHYLRHSKDVEGRLQAIADMLSLRRVLLGEVSALTADRGSATDRTALEELMALQRTHEGQPELIIVTDLEIAMTMVRASGSLSYRWIFNTMAQLFAEIAFQWPLLWVYPPDYIESLGRVIAQVSSGDGAAARESMDSHLRRSDEVIMETLNRLGNLQPAK